MPGLHIRFFAVALSVTRGMATKSGFMVAYQAGCMSLVHFSYHLVCFAVAQVKRKLIGCWSQLDGIVKSSGHLDLVYNQNQCHHSLQ